MDVKEMTLKQLKPKAFIQEQVESIRKTVGDGTAAVALSGGVDSAAVTMLGHLALGPRLKAFLNSETIARGSPARMIPSCGAGRRQGAVLQRTKRVSRIRSRSGRQSRRRSARPRITTGVPGVVSITYNITRKPPSTIEAV